MQMTLGMVDTADVRRRVLTNLYRSRTPRAGKHGCIGPSTPGHSMPTRADGIGTLTRLDASVQLLRPARIRRPLLLISHYFSDTISRDVLPSAFHFSKGSLAGQVRTQEEQGTDIRPIGTDCGHRRHLPVCCHIARPKHQPQGLRWSQSPFVFPISLAHIALASKRSFLAKTRQLRCAFSKGILGEDKLYCDPRHVGIAARVHPLKCRCRIQLLLLFLKTDHREY